MEYREVRERDEAGPSWKGTVSGGPMYYMELGLGKAWKPMAIFFAVCLGLSSFLSGNGVQSNTIADVMQTQFGVSPWVTGLAGALIVGAVIIGGITRIGRVAGILAPAMASVYVAGALIIIILNLDLLLPSLALIVTEAFNPSAGIAGTGVGVFLVTALWGVRRGLFSNEAGLGSAPIAHAAAQTDEPVSEGVVALPRSLHRHDRHLHDDGSRHHHDRRMGRPVPDGDRSRERRPGIRRGAGRWPDHRLCGRAGRDPGHRWRAGRGRDRGPEARMASGGGGHPLCGCWSQRNRSPA